MGNNRTSGEVLVDLINEHSYQEVAEIGSYRGDLALHILARCPNLKHFYLIDPWEIYPEELQSRPFGDYPQEKWDAILEEVCRKIVPWRIIGRAVIMRETSVEAAKRIEDESLDLVYIDGIHTFEYVAQDIQLWLPKVKASGIVSGHDWWDEADGPGGVYFIQNVVKAVRGAFRDEIIQYGDPASAWDHVWWVRKADI